uniref:Coiled-coil domain containing 85B n=1 Tax=Equus caballus TaxID=9796 RepID=A0A9L0RLI2_HORSE
MEAEAGGLEELTDEEMAALGKEELVRRLRREEAARLAALVQRGRLMQEVNRQLQGHLGEIRELKQLNRRLQAENRELRDLCCFLDSERQRGRRAARQWQLFGTQASRAVREDLGGCWQKLAELEGRQEELLRENLALKELCLAPGRRPSSPCPPADPATWAMEAPVLAAWAVPISCPWPAPQMTEDTASFVPTPARSASQAPG